MPELFGLAMQQSAVAMCLVAPDGRFLRVNEAAGRLLDVPAKQLIGMTFQEVTHPDDLDEDMALVEQVRSGDIDSYWLAKRYLRPDGSVVFADLTVTGVRDPDGTLITFLAQIVDVTEQTQARLETRDAREKLRGVIDSLLDPWVLLGAVRDQERRIVDFVYLDANDVACRMNRRTRDALLGSCLLELLPSHRSSGLLADYAAVVETGEPLALDDFPYPSELTDGATRWFDNRAVKVGDGLSFTWRDVTDRVELRQHLAWQASHDSLTGLANRHRLMETIHSALTRVPRTGERVAVLYCDLDGFKTINDSLGHAAGDAVLRAVADRIRSAVREQDLVARIGGDEFVVVAQGVRDEPSARLLATKIAQAVSRPFEHEGRELVPTLSIGISVADPGDDAEEVLRLADRALYRQKSERG